MCGIVGSASAPSQSMPDKTERRAQAIASLRHRGPDDEGQYEDRSVWIAHTRLSILDLSESGRQPMRSADERFVISYNGEVYNFRELAAQHSLDNLRSSSDTEVVLRLFAKFGVESFAQLNGMFAYSLYDKQSQKMWLVRDRLGIKPLYYCVDENELVFASEIKGLSTLSGDTSATCDISAMHEWLYYGNALGGRTLYGGVNQLPPGHYLEIDLRSFEYVVRSYWSLEQEMAIRLHSTRQKDDGRRDATRLLEQAVHRQLVSDVPSRRVLVRWD